MNTRAEHENRLLIKLIKHGVRGAVALLLLLPVAAWAGGVVTNCTESALRAAISGGGVVTFACDGTITLSSTITNNLDVTLDGTGHQLTISGGSAVRVFSVNANISFTIVNLTIANGASPCGSAIQDLGGIVSLTGVTFSGNTAVGAASSDASGGAIWNQAGQVNLRSCALVGNRASGGAGAISIQPQPPGTGGGTGWGGRFTTAAR